MKYSKEQIQEMLDDIDNAIAYRDADEALVYFNNLLNDKRRK